MISVGETLKNLGQHKIGIHVPGLQEDGSDPGIHRGEGVRT